MISYSATGLTISEVIQANVIVWIHSLPETEMGPTRRILEDLDGLSSSGGFRVIERAVSDRAELINTLADLTSQAQQGLRPILHVDAHGTAMEGLLLAPSGERVSWNDVIDLVRDLNIATQNNLTCIFALCFGLHIYKHVSLKKAVPAYFFAAPASEISVGFLEEQTLAFYRGINSAANVTSAFRATLGAQMQSFHCQGLFLQSLIRYIETYCKGKKRSTRQERMVSAILERDRNTQPSSAQLRESRKKIRKKLRPGQDLIDRFASSFLVGRGPAFSYEELDTFLKRKSKNTRSFETRSKK